MRNWLLLAVVAAALGTAAPGSAGAAWDAKQLKALRGAATSLRAAVLTVERDLKGKAFSAVAIVGEAAVTYVVKIDTGDKALMAQVDAKTGKITESGTAAGESLAKIKEFAKLKGSLLAAMKAAESTGNGKSFQAVYKRAGNKDLFEIDIASRDDVEKDVVVDAASGKIRKVEEKTPDPSAQGVAGTAAAGAAAATTTP